MGLVNVDQSEDLCWILVKLEIDEYSHNGDNEGGLELVEQNVFVGFWLNEVSMK